MRRKAEPAVGYWRTISAGVPLHVVQVDVRRPEVHLGVATARYGIGYRDSWSAIIDRTRPAAALTGTYFCTQTAIPVGSIVVAGQRVHTGSVGTALTFSTGQGARLVSVRPGAREHWSGLDMVLRGGPRLLTGGKITLSPRAEGFRDPAIYARKRRTAVALTREGKLLLLAVEKPVRLRTLAAALQKIHAADAMCLDGGGSTALYFRGKTRVNTGRALTNLLVVYDQPARYRQYVATLNPAGPQLAEGASTGSG